MDLGALDQLGAIFSRGEAIAVGLDDRTLARLVHSAQISRLSNGIYRKGTTDLPDPAAISRAMKVVLSHQSGAAWLGGAVPFTPDALHATAPRNRGRRSDCAPGVQLHRADLRPDEIVLVRGVPVTAPARTLLDVARCLPLREAVAIGDSLCRRGGLSREHAIAAALDLAPGVGRPAAVRASGLLDFRAESVFESMTRVDLAVAGLPPPTPQLNIKDRDGNWIARVDFAWEDQRVVLECDGYEFHRDRAAFQRDRRRWSALTRSGWKVIVVTWYDVTHDPAYLIDVMRDLLT
jgi:hypothetical protein